ncbi:universal stress protein [Pontibaca salina]|uniref:Universal stress protein n=1 Tax=Pontibaca salina TaxID=2795731 RepID=A0A934HS81_9RHOB|nr:universal stress protein [Pontibaca salina]MBI6630472.1 universal stress protein [Pontibaca salina]
MIKSVLCAVDISEGDGDTPVLRQAVRLADLDGAQLDVITVLPDYGEGMVSGFFSPTHHDEAMRKATQALRDLTAAILSKERDASVRHIVASGRAYEAILKTARKAGTDLIVIGAHKPDFKDYLLGPNSARVVRHSDCSVFVVRQ